MDSTFGLGCWALGGDSYGEVSEKEASTLLSYAYDEGIRLFDTSPAYGSGSSELRLGKYLAKKSGVIIATKVGMLPHSGHEVPYDFSRKHIQNSIDESLKRLRKEYIDVLQLHSPVKGFEEQFPEVFEVLVESIEAGKVKNIGISLRSPSLFNLQASLFCWKSIQFNLSLLDQRIRKLNFEIQEFDGLRIARTPLNFGFLTLDPPSIKSIGANNHLAGWSNEQIELWRNNARKFEILTNENGISILSAALRYPIDSGIANVVIPGARNITELRDNLNAFRKVKLSRDLIINLEKFYDDEIDVKVESPYKYINSKTSQEFSNPDNQV